MCSSMKTYVVYSIEAQKCRNEYVQIQTWKDSFLKIRYQRLTYVQSIDMDAVSQSFLGVKRSLRSEIQTYEMSQQKMNSFVLVQ